jgi:uncharacterized protein (DUF1499 family)
MMMVSSDAMSTTDTSELSYSTTDYLILDVPGIGYILQHASYLDDLHDSGILYFIRDLELERQRTDADPSTHTACTHAPW